MPRTSFPRDRFDDVADDTGRVGAHRAENPRMRGGVVFLWAAATTVVLVAAGIFGTLVVSGRISLVPEATPTSTPVPVITPVVDTTYSVIVLNATDEANLATTTADAVIAAGWPQDLVSAGEAGSGFETTTVFYPTPEDESAALGLADVIGGAQIAESAQYVQEDDPDTERNEARVLTIVLGLDRVGGAEETPAG